MTIRLLTITLCVCLTVSSVAAQTQTLIPAETERLSAIADQVKAALAAGDAKTANRLASDLMLGSFRDMKAATPTPQDQLQALEAEQHASATSLYFALPKLAVAAFDAGEYDKAELYARQLLTIAAQRPGYGSPGLGVFFDNMIIGRVALRRDKNIALAKASLLAAGKSSGAPTLSCFGPNMSLAKDLIEAGERDVVLEYFTLCRNFWKMGQQKPDNWFLIVKGGGMPDFGASLVYSS
jgi:hypothetical protein